MNKVTSVMGLVVMVVALCSSGAVWAQQEPNLEVAKLWWAELPKKWTMVGWPKHITRFNVLYDGTLVNYFSFMGHTRPAIPEPFVQFCFAPIPSMDQISAFNHATSQDYGDVIQGWNSCETPVLWSEWVWNGYLLRQEVFAHVPGGQELRKGDEPLFAWIRLSVHYASSGLPLEQSIGFGIKLNAFVANTSMELRHNLNLTYSQPKYPRDLRAEPEAYQAGQAFRILEADGRVRLAVAPGADCRATFKNGAPSEQDSALHVCLAPTESSYVDLLIPMLPTDRATFDKELALGYDGALRQAEAFWSKKPATAATFEVPEEAINQAIRRNLQFARITAEKDPATGKDYVLTGSLVYGVATWATPISIALAGLLDTLGHHALVEEYLDVFKEAQGLVLPPGDSFQPHPGYLGVPPRVKIVNWLPDHGAILWVMSQHGLLSKDPEFIKEYTPVIVKACEWIQYARRIEGHGGAQGVMPPAGASDDESRVQSCWTDGWIYKGLSTAVKFLKATGHPRAAEFEAEAQDYREAFNRAFRAKSLTMPTWVDNRGRERRLAPLALAKEQDHHYRHLFYLDTGPMHLVFAGLMNADDPLMQDAVAWFREGPPTRLYRPYGNLTHVPSLRHEMSSWEACYSWNILHSWQLGDRQHFLEGMYSQFAGAMSQQTYTVCESRGGITANIHWMPTAWFARCAVIDDQIKENELHLLRLAPLAWLRTDRASRFLKIPTYYGPVDLVVQLAEGGKTLDVTFSGASREKPKRIVLHVPRVKGLERVKLNGKVVPWDGKVEAMEIHELL